METKDSIYTKLKKEFGKKRVYEITTQGYDLTTNPKGRNSKKDRRDWADSVFEKLYPNKKRSEIIKESRKYSSGEYSFSYIKFATDDRNNIYGIVSGKSSFHCMYPGDVWFYDISEEEKKDAALFMKKNHLEWYKNSIIIVLNSDPLNHKEAYENESILKKLFGLYD